jgi:hypothetical protein
VLTLRASSSKPNSHMTSDVVPSFRCLSPACGRGWYGSPCLTTCRACGHLYVEWVNFASWRVHPLRAEYRERLGEALPIKSAPFLGER